MWLSLLKCSLTWIKLQLCSRTTFAVYPKMNWSSTRFYLYICYTFILYSEVSLNFANYTMSWENSFLNLSPCLSRSSRCYTNLLYYSSEVAYSNSVSCSLLESPIPRTAVCLELLRCSHSPANARFNSLILRDRFIASFLSPQKKNISSSTSLGVDCERIFFLPNKESWFSLTSLDINTGCRFVWNSY